jgi:hypothetical protein
LEDRSLLSTIPTAPNDVLYVGDGADNSVQRFDATTGVSLGAEVAPGAGGLNGPRGLLFRNRGQLLVVDQNVNEPNPGEVLRYNGPTGTFLDNVVLQTDPNAPFAPRGMVLGPNHILYVADDGNLDGITLGRVARFNGETGAFLGDLQHPGFTGDFYARGVVLGPDGLLYASIRNIAPTGGEIMRWDPATGDFLGSFVTSNAVNDLNRPEGVAFGPDGNLYVCSFRANSHDTDKVLEFDGQTGAYLGKIDLDAVGQPRAFAQALLFGPGGRLFVPITGGGPDTGAVRSYDVTTRTFTNFVAPGTLGQPWYLTFGNTDPATLAYNPGPAAPASNPAAAPSSLTSAPGGTPGMAVTMAASTSGTAANTAGAPNPMSVALTGAPGAPATSTLPAGVTAGTAPASSSGSPAAAPSGPVGAPAASDTLGTAADDVSTARGDDLFGDPLADPLAEALPR